MWSLTFLIRHARQENTSRPRVVNSAFTPAILTAMRLTQRQHCVSSEPWFGQDIPSQTTKGVTYRVYSPYPDDVQEELTCECQGFIFRGWCVHQQLAFENLCRWTETDGPEEQTPHERRNKICPRCGDETIKATEL